MSTTPPTLPLPPVSGTYNLRSLAGLRTRDGRTLAAHRLLRSDRLSRLSAADWDTLGVLGLRTICDLRGQLETEQSPTHIPAHWQAQIRILALDIRNDVRSDAALMQPLLADPTADSGERLMQEIYRRFPRVFATRLPALWAALCDGPEPPNADSTESAGVLVHCAAGKDRTGFVVAMLLHALEVADDDIMADYLQAPPSLGEADPRLQAMRQHLQTHSGRDVPAAALVPILSVKAEYLQTAWRVLHTEHGGPLRYLTEVTGLTPERRERLRARLLTPV